MDSLTSLTSIHAKVAFRFDCLYQAIHPEEKKRKYISYADKVVIVYSATMSNYVLLSQNRVYIACSQHGDRSSVFQA